jgi:protein-S-isoprenylcysteine O-methyltransferase Ste14
MTSATHEGGQQGGINKRRLIGSLLVMPVYFALFMFLPAGTWAWTRGWLFIGVFLTTVAIASWLLWRVNPDVVAARTRSHEGTKGWDKVWLPVFLTAVYTIIPVAALDDGRFGWFPVHWWVCGVGYLLFLAGMGLVTWAEAVNRFFEVTVRIQTERGHTVIDRGPYALVRHPGYVGGVLFCLGTALCLGSLWALIPAGLGSALLVLRALWEDQMLQAELAGYKEYAARVRYRLIPGVW